MPQESKRIVHECGGLRLIREREQWFLENADEGTTSAPLHHTIVAAIMGRPSNLLDLVMGVPTPRMAPPAN